MISDWIDGYNVLLANRKPWLYTDWSIYWMALEFKAHHGMRQSKLKPGKNWKRTIAYYIHSIVRDAEPIKKTRERSYTTEIMDYHKHINARKRWKQITPHHGYLYWRRMK